MNRSISIVALACGVSASTVVAQQAVQWKVSEGGNGHWYAFQRFSAGRTFDAAAAEALSVGAHLATVTSGGENEWLKGAVVIPAADSQIWGPSLGGRKVKGAWVWTTGEPWSFADWGSGEPSGDGPLLQYWRYGALWWNDYVENGSTNKWIFEWSADCNNDGIVDYGQCRDGTLPDYNGNNIPDCCEGDQPCVAGSYPVQWRVSDGGNGHWYQLRANTGRRFWDLVSDANAVGGFLVTLTSEEENAFVRLISIGTFVHFGAFHDSTLPGYAEPGLGWRWVNGESWQWSGWCNGQPDNAPWGGFSGQELARFNGSTVACWDDADSTAQIASIAIEATMFEWSADCNSDGIVDYGQILQGQLADANANGVPDSCESPTCADADLYPNGAVNGADLGIMLSEWGAVTPATSSDLNRDGTVDGSDLGILLAFWGPCTP